MEASHRTHTHDREPRQKQQKAPTPYSTRPNATVPQTSQSHPWNSNKPTFARNRLSTSSSISGGRRSTGSGDEYSATALRPVRPSALPRSKTTHSGSRLDAIASSRPAPNLISLNHPNPPGSASLHEAHDGRGQSQHILRRKPPTVKPLSSKSSGDLGLSPKTSFDIDNDSIFGAAFPERQRPTRSSVNAPNMSTRSQRQFDLPPRLIPELQALATAHMKAQTSLSHSISSISSPSTQYTESPGPYSSRNTTPMSMSSYSPGIVQPLRVNHSGKRANTVPIPANSRTRVPRLPVLRETLTSSSSSSTGKDNAYHQDPASTITTPKKKKRSRLVDDAAPTPPPRSSSVKRENVGDVLDSGVGYGNPINRNNEDLNNAENSPLAKRSSRTFEKSIGDSLPARVLPTTREEAEAWQQKPLRPSRSQIVSLEPRQPLHLRPNMATYNPQSKRGNDILQRPERPSVLAPDLPPKGSRNNQAKSRASRTLATPFGSPNPLPQNRNFPPKIDQIVSQGGQVDAVTPAKKMSKLSRLGAFMRRAKTPDEPNLAKASPRKLQRKGPAAGTGHEGYGKYTKHSKKSSRSSMTVGSEMSTTSLEKIPSLAESRKTSNSSRRNSKIRISQSELDDFVGQRLQPVVIMGGSRRSTNESQRTWQPPEGSILGPVQHSTQRLVEVSHQGGDFNGTGELKYQTVDMTHNFESSEAMTQELQSNGPIDPGFYHQATSSVASNDSAALPFLRRTRTPQSSISTSDNTAPAFERQMHVVDETLLKKQDKKGRKLKWNIFSRNNSSNKIENSIPLRAEPSPDLPVRISAIPVPRSVPYYAMMESESDNNISEIGDFLEEAAQSVPARPYGHETLIRPHDQPHRPSSVLLPSMPLFEPGSNEMARPASSQVSLRKEPGAASPNLNALFEGKPRRLAQVGRIPMVVSRKDRRHTPNAHSFSRPFQPVHSDAERASEKPPTFENERPMLEIHTDVLPSRPFYEFDSSKPVSAPAQMLSDIRDHGFFPRTGGWAYPSSQGSQISVSSGSESIPAPTRTLPRTPLRPASRYHNGEDEVWNEYDDFIDHVMSPSKSESKQARAGHSMPAQSSSPLVPQQEEKHDLEDRTPKRENITLTTQTPAIVFPPPLSEPQASGETRLRRSRIISALHSSIDPSSPFSVAKFFAGYGERDKPNSDRLSTSTEGASGFLSPLEHGRSNLMSVGDFQSNQPDVVLFDVVEKESDPVADSELHFASLMISRWLSFGRVLFSPAQDEVYNQPDRHVLVIDGLRNDDFSYYCSVTFTRAYVHSLKESDPSRRRRPSDLGNTPPNYRIAEVSSFADRFPFPPSFFSAVVLRFLPAMSDRSLQNIIAEAKRVLAPGGHLELMLLDLDIVNMGPQTRRAIREMKIRTSNTDSGISLKPISDNVQGILGRKGFSNLNRCVVGVPVAGKIAGSMDSSSESRSSGGSFAQPRRTSAEGPKAATHSSHPHTGENFSLNDLISDHTPGSDEKIAKIVSKTARFWFSHCYEPGVVQRGKRSRSILSDRKVLHECKMRASSFKLLIAHTQKPSEFKRRTVSEPMLPTLATAGGAQPMKKLTL